MSKVFVLDTKKRPLNPVHPGRARLLLTQGKAAAGAHVGRVTIRQRPVFRLAGHDVPARYCTRLQKGDGYAYALGRVLSPVA